MNPRELVKTNKLLLGGTAVLSLGALLCGHATGILAGKWAVDALAIAGFAGNVLSGMSANNIGELVKKLRENPDILKNDDLAKATGLAIALGIRSVSDRDEFAELRHILRGLADKTVEYWVEMPRETVETQELSPIDETQIRYAFSANAGGRIRSPANVG